MRVHVSSLPYTETMDHRWWRRGLCNGASLLTSQPPHDPSRLCCPNKYCRHTIVFDATHGSVTIMNLDSYTVFAVFRYLAGKLTHQTVPDMVTHFSVHVRNTLAGARPDGRDWLAEDIVAQVQDLLGFGNALGSQTPSELRAEINNTRALGMTSYTTRQTNGVSVLFGECPSFDSLACVLFTTAPQPSTSPDPLPLPPAPPRDFSALLSLSDNDDDDNANAPAQPRSDDPATPLLPSSPPPPEMPADATIVPVEARRSQRERKPIARFKPSRGPKRAVQK